MQTLAEDAGDVLTLVSAQEPADEAMQSCLADRDHWNSVDVGQPASSTSLSDIQAFHSACASAQQGYEKLATTTATITNWLPYNLLLGDRPDEATNSANAQQLADWTGQMMTWTTTIVQLSAAATACTAALQTFNGRDMVPVTVANGDQTLQDLQAEVTACAAQEQAFAAYTASDSFPLETTADLDWIQKSIAAATGIVTWAKQDVAWTTTVLQLVTATAACTAAGQTWNGRDSDPITPANIDQMQQDLQAYATACAAEGQAFATYSAPNSFPLETAADVDWIQKSIAASAADAQWVATTQQILNTARASFGGAHAPQPTPVAPVGGNEATATPVASNGSVATTPISGNGSAAIPIVAGGSTNGTGVGTSEVVPGNAVGAGAFSTTNTSGCSTSNISGCSPAQIHQIFSNTCSGCLDQKATTDPHANINTGYSVPSSWSAVNHIGTIDENTISTQASDNMFSGGSFNSDSSGANDG
jgi:hypothetical protein